MNYLSKFYAGQLAIGFNGQNAERLFDFFKRINPKLDLYYIQIMIGKDAKYKRWVRYNRFAAGLAYASEGWTYSDPNNEFGIKHIVTCEKFLQQQQIEINNSALATLFQL